MKNFFILTTILLINGFTSFAQRIKASPLTKVEQEIGLTTMRLEYSRLSLDQRKVEDIIYDRTNGAVWRTGANMNTLISFDKDVLIGGKALRAGLYSLWTIPNKEEWIIIINKFTSKWGTQYDSSGDILRFNAKARSINEHIETLEIHMTEFNKTSKDRASIEIRLGNIAVKFPIIVNNSL